MNDEQKKELHALIHKYAESFADFVFEDVELGDAFKHTKTEVNKAAQTLNRHIDSIQ